jgi:ribosomal protein L37AE/L43A
MKKLTYDQVYAIYSDKIEKCTGKLPAGISDMHTSDESKSIFMMESIVDAINKSIEQHNAKQYICNECDGWLTHIGVQTDTVVQIYRCDACGNIVNYDNYNKLLTPPIDNG